MKSLHPSIRACLDLESYKVKLALARATLAGGITAVSADQLFPTPRDVAERLVAAARIQPGDRILEPEAGTAAILRAIVQTKVPDLQLVAVEIVPMLAEQLGRMHPSCHVVCADFLSCSPGKLGRFRRIVTNPPFKQLQDVEHVEHALQFLEPDGVVAAIMLNDGHAFRRELTGEKGHGRRAERVATLRTKAQDLGRVMSVEELPADAFKNKGTAVRTVLVTLE